ncbi:centrosomal protein of 295 kDa isoform X7 [Apodemus sylvaticus]|uniref:centrosomal protein of 295 kDa isoform X7 n=1 Tax=Apodemus sylvaticus TaxID=10129 RepID=UPI0022435FF5|nr:centrosomal protein of 295 kDa isoform X7 [Apodemus sylvaticus]
MTEVTRAGPWQSRRYPNGCWVAGRVRVPVSREGRPHTLSDPLYLKYSEMRRKVMNAKLRLSPNEEAFILREDYERRRKLRLLQVREQERGIAFQIREGIKQRRNQQVSHLAEELRAEWEEAQSQKIQNLEKLYLASLRHMGDGHRQAKENEPDLDALSRQAAERKRKAEMRHKEALKVQKSQKEMLMKQKTRHIKARKEAVLVEKQRSAKMARLPPPVPSPFENIDINRIPSLKTNSSTYHHISTFVSRQMDSKQPDAHLAAEEEARRVERQRKQVAQERMEQFERAHVRGSQAMKKIHLAQNQERLMEELKQLQKEDLARRKQTVAQMPPQLLELPYRRSEVKEDWQRELEFAFEDMYNADRKVKGNLILHLKPEPLPTMSDPLQDEELDLSMEQESQGETEKPQVPDSEIICPSGTVPLAMKTQQIPSRILFKKLLNKIRSQKSLWTIKSASEDEGEVTASISEIESKVPSMDSGAVTTEERAASFAQEQAKDSDRLTIESGPLSSEDKPFFYKAGPGKEQAMAVSPPATAVTQSSVLLHPQEEAVRIRMSVRRKQIMEIEEQKQKQLELLEQIEQQKLRLETDCFRAQLEEQKKKADQLEVCPAPVSHAMISDEDCHRQMIRNYQHQLLQQNRLHKQTVETARKRLLEYQTILKERCPPMSATSLRPDSVVSGPPQQSQKPAAASDYWDPSQRLKLSPSKYQHVQPSQIPTLEQSHIQVPRQGHVPQRQGETAVSKILAKQSVESQERQQQFSQVETHQRDSEFVLKDSHSLSKTLSSVRPQTLQDAGEVSEPLRAVICQSSDSQQISSEDSENISSKPTETSSFLPMVPEHPFTSLPVKLESGTIQKPFTTINQSVISHMHDEPLSSSEIITAQRSDLRFLQEQLELQKKVLQARQEAQEKLLLCTQKELEQQTGLPVFLPSPVGNIFSSLPSTSAESGNIHTSSTESNATVSSDNMDRFWDSSQPISSRQTNLEFLREQFGVEKDNLQARREAQEVWFAHTQNKLDDTVRSEQAGSWPHQVAQQSFSSLASADTQSRKIQKQPLPTNKGLFPSQSEASRAQDGSSGFLQEILPLQNTLKLLQERLTLQRSKIQPRHDAQEALLLHKERCSGDSEAGPVNSLPTVVAQHSDASHVVSEVGPRRLQELFSCENEDTVLCSHLITPAVQEESQGLPQHSLPRREHFTSFQEQTHIERVILGARKKSQEFAHKQNELEKGLCSQQTGALSSPSQVTEWEISQESVSVKSDSTGPLSHFKIPGFQERLVRVSQHTFPLQDNLQEYQEWVGTEKKSFQFSPQTQENPSSQHTGFLSFEPSFRLPSCVSLPSADSDITQQPLSPERDSKVKPSHLQIPELQHRLSRISQLIQPQQDSLKALQEQLATQREAIIHSRQETHEETLKEWKEKIFPEQDNRTEQLDLEMVFPEELLLQKQKSQNKSESPEHSLSALFLSKEIEHPFIPLPFAETKSKSICELNLSEKEHGAPPNDAAIPRLQDRLLSYSQPALTQQDMSLQTQLNLQREALHLRQKAQEELLVQRQTSLQQQIQKHRETLKDFFNVSQARNPTGENDLEIQKIEQLTSWFPHIQGLTWRDSGQGSSSGEQPHLADVHSERSGESLGKELSGRASKPPVSKVKCVLDLNQHELSTIQEVESPASCRISMPGKQGKAEFYQDRDPLRVSVSREQSFLGSLLAHDPFGCHQPPAQENSKSHNSAEAVKVKKSDVEDHAILSHAILEEEACIYSGPLVKPEDEAETQEISQEPLSSVTVSTGSFLSYEITDLSLTDPESFSEQTEHQEQEVTNKQGESDPLSPTVPSIQVIYHHQHSLGAHNSLLPTEEESTSDHPHVQQIVDEDIHEATMIPDKRDFQAVHLDFPELEHLFPHLHRQLFKPLEPHLDFDFSSPGTSQEDRDFYQQSSESTSEKHVKALSTSTICFTALTASSHSPNTRLNQQLDVNLAHATTEGSEQSFQQLLPEFSSQESQHADLPSIYSIEARGTSQSMENQNYSQILQNKIKSIYLQPSTENLNPAYSSSDTALFDQLHLQHSTPCGSTSSECSVKQLESREEMLGFEELSRRVVTMSQRLTKDENVVLPINPHVERVEMETSVQESNSLSIQNEEPIQNVIKTETTKAVTNVSPLAQAEHILESESCPLRSPIPVWETETGYGIMEEPDLTLVSTSDISITETDLANLTLEDRESNEASFQAGVVLPTSSMETSVCEAVSEPCVDTRTPPVAPGSLQEAFMKRKKTLMERSYQRQREIWNKTRLLQTKVSKEKLSAGSASLPEEKKAAQALVHQRALRYLFILLLLVLCYMCQPNATNFSYRLYRQLAGAKQQREEKTKQEKG